MVANTTAQFTFLNAKSYYTISTLVDDTTQLFFTRTGANDPDFNLRREPAFIVRKKGQSRSFINVLEIHGKYDPVYEFSSNAYPSAKQIKLVEQDDQYTIAEIIVGTKKLIIAQCNKNFDNKQVHAVQGFSWPGPFMVLYDGKKL